MTSRSDLPVDSRPPGDASPPVCPSGVFYALSSRFSFLCFDLEPVMTKYNFDNSMLVPDISKLLYIARINFCSHVTSLLKNI